MHLKNVMIYGMEWKLNMNIVDTGYWSWYAAYGVYKAKQEGRTIDPYISLSFIDFNNTILAIDSVTSVRKDHFPWYKSNRSNPSQISEDMRVIANRLILELTHIYPSSVRAEAGLEADDVIAIYAKPGDMIFSNDKDYLQLDEGINITNFNGEFITCDRFKAPHLNIKRGQASLAYQLMFGDAADAIPRRYYGDKEIAVWVFEQDNPLYEAIKLIPPQQVKVSLAALSLPTTLWTLDKHLINGVLDRYM